MYIHVHVISSHTILCTNTFVHLPAMLHSFYNTESPNLSRFLAFGCKESVPVKDFPFSSPTVLFCRTNITFDDKALLVFQVEVDRLLLQNIRQFWKIHQLTCNCVFLNFSDEVLLSLKLYDYSQQER